MDDLMTLLTVLFGGACTLLGGVGIYYIEKYSLQGTTQGNGLTGGLPPVRFSM